MSVWEFHALVHGYNAVHGGEGDNGMSEKEEAEIWAWMNELDGAVAH